MSAAWAFVAAAGLAGGQPASVLYPPDGTRVEVQDVTLLVRVPGAPADLRVLRNGEAISPAAARIGGAMKEILHARIVLSPGENRIEVFSGAARAPIARTDVYRQSTLGAISDVPERFSARTLHTQATEAACATCHAMPDHARTPRGARLEDPSCFACHRPVLDRAKPHGPVAVSACLACHDPKSRPRFQVLQPVQETCFRCHSEIRDAMERKAFRHGPAAAGRCTTCHDPHGSEHEFWLKKPVFDLCTNCHTEKAMDRHVVAGFVYGDSHPVRGRPHLLKPGKEHTCASCHNPHAAEARYLWQFDATKRFDLCQKCHQK